VLCCAVLCCAVLRCAVLCCAVLCCAVLCCAVLCRPGLGVSRVVVGRELSVREIAKVAAHTRSEVEAFCHGALCVSYSGQCFSSGENQTLVKGLGFGVPKP